MWVEKKKQMTIEFFENVLRILTEKQVTSANDSENNSWHKKYFIVPNRIPLQKFHSNSQLEILCPPIFRSIFVIQNYNKSEQVT